ncbi:hypothetical protein [Mucilaginibacter sp.]|uniref:hypothetical protein n=1 Tax=Mucilaginibacter sp. TaxID=1882438 RepID=UPI003D0FFB53
MIGFRKHRGLKRYYKNLAIQNDFEKFNWRDCYKQSGYWHLHFDWYGYGNNSFQRRKPHLDKLFKHFDILVEETKSLGIEFQLYIMLLDFHSANDSLYLHPPVPNNKRFPFKISDLKSTTTLKNKAINNYIDNLVGYEKMYGSGGDEAFCLLFKKNVGVPF